MDQTTQLLLTKKLLESCDLDGSAAFYTLIPGCQEQEEHHQKIQDYTLDQNTVLIDSALNIFAGTKTNVAKSAAGYKKILQNKEKLLDRFSSTKELLQLPEQLSSDRIAIALSIISHSYFKSLTHPVQFFLPHSAACSGQWSFWEKNDYFALLQRITEKEFNFQLRDQLTEHQIWNSKFQPEEFTEIVRRRLNKENAFNQKLNPEALIKAMIIRLGEMAKPEINYEVIDYAIRSFFTYLDVKQYLRVDREIKFLRALETEMMKSLSSD